MAQNHETLPEVLKKVSNRLVNAADELNRLNRLQHLLIGALNIIQENTDQAELMLELYETHMSEYLADLSKSLAKARKLLGHPVSECDLVIQSSKHSSSHHKSS